MHTGWNNNSNSNSNSNSNNNNNQQPTTNNQQPTTNNQQQTTNNQQQATNNKQQTTIYIYPLKKNAVDTNTKGNVTNDDGSMSGKQAATNRYPICKLVGGFNHLEKYESRLGWLFPIYGKIKAMFQTTNL